jgi:hypothetical protein
VFLLMIAAMIWLGVQVLTQRSAIRELESRLDLIDEEETSPAVGGQKAVDLDEPIVPFLHTS